MYYIVDLLRRGDEHGNINIPIIRALVNNQSSGRAWLSQDSTASALLPRTEKYPLTRIEILSTKKYKWITSTLLTIKILFQARKKNYSIVFLSTTPLHNFLITTSTIMRKNDAKHYVFLHGELSYLVSPNGLGRILGKIFLDLTFRILPFSNTTQITLAYPVFRELKKRYRLNCNVANLEMPIENSNLNAVLKRRMRKLRIGSFGVQCRDKKSHLIYELADLLQKNSDEFEILTIGVAHSDFEYDQHPIVKHRCRGSLESSLAPKESFIEEVKELDFALFFYGGNPQYELVSSGAFIDCINYCIPFAALESGYFAHYIEKYGEIGIVKKSLSELAVELVKMLKDYSVVSKYKENLRALRGERGLDRFERQFLNILQGDCSDNTMS